jgi:hypothetical protein
MPFPSPTVIEQIRGGPERDEWAHLYAQIEGYLRKEHKENGAHADVTADSLTVDGDATVTGDLSVEGGLDVEAGSVALGDIPAAAGGFTGGYGVELGRWTLVDDRVSSEQGLRLEYRAHAGADTFVFKVLPVGPNQYTLTPETGTALNLGRSTHRLATVVSQAIDALQGYTERGRTVALGVSIPVPFVSINFTGTGGMTWTVNSGDQITFAYELTGKWMTLTFDLATTSIGGVVGTDLHLPIPDGFLAAAQTNHVGVCRDNGVAGGLWGITQFATGFIILRKLDFSAWTLSTDNTYVGGTFRFEVL